MEIEARDAAGGVIAVAVVGEGVDRVRVAVGGVLWSWDGKRWSIGGIIAKLRD